MDFDPNIVTVGMFGTCDTSIWRTRFITKYDKLGVVYYNPQRLPGQWEEWMKVEERKHLYNDHIILFPVLAESYGIGSLGETGFSVIQALGNLNRDVVVMIEQYVDPILEVKNAELAKASKRGRALVAEHLSAIRSPHLYVVPTLDDMLDVSLGLYHSQVALQKAREITEHAQSVRLPFQRFINQ